MNINRLGKYADEVILYLAIVPQIDKMVPEKQIANSWVETRLRFTRFARRVCLCVSWLVPANITKGLHSQPLLQYEVAFFNMSIGLVDQPKMAASVSTADAIFFSFL